MSIHRYNARRDENEKFIVHILETFGATVWRISSSKAGCPDLLVLYRGKAYALEVKSGQGHILQSQKKAENEGVIIVRTPDEALNAIGIKI